MKFVVLLLKRGLENPRFYIEALHIKWRYLFVLSCLISALIGLNYQIEIQPVVQNLKDNILSSTEYIPHYQVENGELKLEDKEKALYYHSEYFQLIVDDQVQNKDIHGGIQLQTKNPNQIDPSTLINLFIIKDQMILYTKGSPQIFTMNLKTFSNEEVLKDQILAISNQSLAITIIIYFACMMIAFLTYWYLMLLTGLFAGLLNVKLNMPLPLLARMKMSIITSFVPLLMIQIIRFFIPSFHVNYYLFIALIIFLIYLSFKNHTQHLHNIVKDLQTKDLTFEEFKNLVDHRLKKEEDNQK
ncbi:DUF1189 family protein [Facklamia sp. DSM 111018]|uniref:DUF1189 family protein n=1 Tax=Facklamia lactis TaxID=2749967 RepID=A0ABS0LQX3_9LACT|nr:DUF1189 family protein [Facklamia lactis]MBG9980073.1 DUF1189 family protein [Facklamia lactis]MBG9985875.1 DUF1189 family protein [Facklamia lactis]